MVGLIQRQLLVQARFVFAQCVDPPPHGLRAPPLEQYYK
jgi:hypothetical protein